MITAKEAREIYEQNKEKDSKLLENLLEWMSQKIKEAAKEGYNRISFDVSPMTIISSYKSQKEFVYVDLNFESVYRNNIEKIKTILKNSGYDIYESAIVEPITKTYLQITF